MGVGFAEWYSWSSARDERLASLFYRHVDPGDIADRDPEAVVGAVTHLIDVARHREPQAGTSSGRSTPRSRTTGGPAGAPWSAS